MKKKKTNTDKSKESAVKALAVDTKVGMALDLKDMSLALKAHGSTVTKFSLKKLMMSLSKTSGRLREVWRRVPTSGQSATSTGKMDRKDRSSQTTRGLKGDYLRPSRGNTQSIQ